MIVVLFRFISLLLCLYVNESIKTQVSGDNPVYVESVKPGGAAQKAGLLEGDMILKVTNINKQKTEKKKY